MQKIEAKKLFEHLLRNKLRGRIVAITPHPEAIYSVMRKEQKRQYKRQTDLASMSLNNRQTLLEYGERIKNFPIVQEDKLLEHMTDFLFITDKRDGFPPDCELFEITRVPHNRSNVERSKGLGNPYNFNIKTQVFVPSTKKYS